MIKSVLSKMDFIIRQTNLEIDANAVGEITREEAEREIKKSYLSLKVWMMRYANVAKMNFPPEDDETQETNSGGGIQIPLFTPEDFS